MLSDQSQFREIVEPSLFADVVFAGDRAGQWWPLGRERYIAVDPDCQGGVPYISDAGVRTEVVFDMAETKDGGENGKAAAAS